MMQLLINNYLMALNARKQQNKSQESEKIIAKKLNASHNYKLMEEFLHKKSTNTAKD